MVCIPHNSHRECYVDNPNIYRLRNICRSCPNWVSNSQPLHCTHTCQNDRDNYILKTKMWKLVSTETLNNKNRWNQKRESFGEWFSRFISVLYLFLAFLIVHDLTYENLSSYFHIQISPKLFLVSIAFGRNLVYIHYR